MAPHAHTKTQQSPEIEERVESSLRPPPTPNRHPPAPQPYPRSTSSSSRAPGPGRCPPRWRTAWRWSGPAGGGRGRCCFAGLAEPSRARGTARPGGERWAPETRWTSCRTVYLRGRHTGWGGWGLGVAQRGAETSQHRGRGAEQRGRVCGRRKMAPSPFQQRAAIACYVENVFLMSRPPGAAG